MPSKYPKIDIGRRLAAARLQHGVSQGSVARRAGIAPSYLSRIETGKVHPTFRTVLRIVDTLKVPIGEIAGRGGGAKRQTDGCPVTAGGHCLLDLIRSEQDARRGGEDEAYTPREVKLLRRFGSWMRGASPDRLRAMEILLEDLTEPRAGRPALSGRS